MFSRKLGRNRDKLLCVFQDGTVSIEQVSGTDGEVLETENRLLNLADLDAFVNVDGSILYASNLDIRAKAESEDLVKLRRSVVIKNIFDFKKDKKVNFSSFFPWIAIIIVVILLS